MKHKPLEQIQAEFREAEAKEMKSIYAAGLVYMLCLASIVGLVWWIVI